MLQEMFTHGSLFSVKELRIVRGERRDITFYAAARLDGLLRREEVFGCKLTEHFMGRDDNLIYRSATFGGAAGGVSSGTGGASSGYPATASGMATDSPAEILDTQPLESAAGYGLPNGQQQQPRALPVVKVTQKFARNLSKPADVDVAKQVFHLALGQTTVQFHHASDRLAAGHLVFQRDGPAQAVQVGHKALEETSINQDTTTVLYECVYPPRQHACQHGSSATWHVVVICSCVESGLNLLLGRLTRWRPIPLGGISWRCTAPCRLWRRTSFRYTTPMPSALCLKACTHVNTLTWNPGRRAHACAVGAAHSAACSEMHCAPHGALASRPA